MSERSPIPLTARLIITEASAPQSIVDDADWQAIRGWAYADEFVHRMLLDDIPQRIQTHACDVIAYRDPASQLVGFGAVEICDEYAGLLGGRSHAYLPLLAVNPGIKSLGYGSTILSHLLETAAQFKQRPAWSSTCEDVFVLDVYERSAKALALYEKFGFEKLVDRPFYDPAEAGAPYFVMFKPL